MEADNNPPVPHAISRASYEAAEDFPLAVDIEAFRLVAEMNLRGLRVVREALADGRSSGLAAVDALRSDWLALDEAALARVAEAPFLLFELSIDAALTAHRSPSWAVSDDPHRVVSWCARPAGRAFARLLCHFCWQTCRTAPTAASLLLGSHRPAAPRSAPSRCRISMRSPRSPDIGLRYVGAMNRGTGRGVSRLLGVPIPRHSGRTPCMVYSGSLR